LLVFRNWNRRRFKKCWWNRNHSFL